MAQETTDGSSSKSSTDPSGERRLRIGTVGKPHGTRGEFTVADPTDRLHLFDPGCTVRVGSVDHAVASRSGAEPHPVIRLEGVADRNGAEQLRGLEISVPREAIGDLEPDEYLADDLIGLAVVDGERAVGTVTNVLLLPSADVLEVQREGAKPLLVPLIRDAVRSIDPAAAGIDIDLGFLGEQ